MPLRILVLALGTFAIGTDGFVIARDLGVPVATAGLLVTVFAVTYALGSPLLATTGGSA